MKCNLDRVRHCGQELTRRNRNSITVKAPQMPIFNMPLGRDRSFLVCNDCARWLQE